MGSWGGLYEGGHGTAYNYVARRKHHQKQCYHGESPHTICHHGWGLLDKGLSTVAYALVQCLVQYIATLQLLHQFSFGAQPSFLHLLMNTFQVADFLV
jgi:hypothetical protein